ncbi:hypothetical protein ACFW16_35555 [Inquilinus sp. NPDC058860]|uniref:hypothetical protein n=1 Tax=Inquilinus sp. NPDC058860 TaxID=3346652 RepID=UPI0036B6ADE0
MQMLDARDPIRLAAPPAGADDHVLQAELQPALRSTVPGPEPFNALVLVRGTLPAGAMETGGTFAVPTNFTLAGFDPADPPPFKHSSTAALRRPGAPDAEIEAIDHGFFDDAGRWVLLVRGESLRRRGAVELTSWVMCREPAAGEADGRLGFRSYPSYVPPRPPQPADAWDRAVARLFPRRPDAGAHAPA